MIQNCASWSLQNVAAGIRNLSRKGKEEEREKGRKGKKKKEKGNKNERGWRYI